MSNPITLQFETLERMIVVAENYCNYNPQVQKVMWHNATYTFAHLINLPLPNEELEVQSKVTMTHFDESGDSHTHYYLIREGMEEKIFQTYQGAEVWYYFLQIAFGLSHPGKSDLYTLLSEEGFYDEQLPTLQHHIDRCKSKNYLHNDIRARWSFYIWKAKRGLAPQTEEFFNRQGFSSHYNALNPLKEKVLKRFTSITELSGTSVSHFLSGNVYNLVYPEK